ncbi:formate dehydrogenase accessory sulfurtransferase FdhD [Desulfovibrio intestinalis]|uniref:Sulfur carrier protein FdhD n=1 Tax=Desulfovibrio intestinalis TaxID=58621 RepID=A0A7W8BYK5_9BACT|nr:formate dehydrogenase accessory sulfurtransferase FdhD [Desulfovibrio intestinalis]MBB5142345.1 FdhD protein [Desulfovibrio intestinalis]
MPTFSLPPACVLRTITRINNTGRREVEDILLREEAYDLICNDKTVARMHCMPTHLEELAVGRLFTMGMLQDACQITSLRIQHPLVQNARTSKDPARATSDKDLPDRDVTSQVAAAHTIAATHAEKTTSVEDTACTATILQHEQNLEGQNLEAQSLEKPRSAGSIWITTTSELSTDNATEEAEVRLTAAQVHKLQAEFEERCVLFRQTGAAHSCALATEKGILMFYEDIARHNALDKLIGAMQLQAVSPQGKLMIFSGRLAVDMLEKAVVSGVRLLIAPGAPSLASVELAETKQVSLLGFVRKDNINIYTCPHRIV